MYATVYKQAGLALGLMLFFMVPPPAAMAQNGELPAIYEEPMPLFPAALGSFSRPISSSNEEAQAYFDQGFQMMFAFTPQDARRSFRQAWKLDPNCAICFWGEAWAWGPYLNGGMSKQNAVHAYNAIQKAKELAEDHATPVEQAFIDAMAVRYVENFEPADRPVQDTLYAKAMYRVTEAYPADLDAGTLYAEALFLLEPRRGLADIGDPDVAVLHAELERVLREDITHPGACHLYIHATESSSNPGLAEACADHLGSAIPGASHINHMPSHTYNEIGRWGDAVRANIQAWHSDLKAEIGEGFAIYPSHNLHMLLFAGSMDGQGGVSIQAGRDYEALTGNSMYHALTLIRFGRFDEVMNVAHRPKHDVQGGMWDFARGYAHLRLGRADYAKLYLERIRAAADTSKARFRFHPANNLLNTVAGILEGEILRDAGKLDKAIEVFQQTVEVEDQLAYDEPEPLPFAARHWLGAALLEADRYTEAEQVYRDELADHPNNGWSYYGLKQALAGQGKSDPELDAAFEESWARADVWIRASRF